MEKGGYLILFNFKRNGILFTHTHISALTSTQWMGPGSATKITFAQCGGQKTRLLLNLYSASLLPPDWQQ